MCERVWVRRLVGTFDSFVCVFVCVDMKNVTPHRMSSFCGVSQCVAVCGSVLQCVAVCCSVLQCVAVCCSVCVRENNAFLRA